jgi:hypothetical protein
MLDGLDEVPEGTRRDRVREAVEELAATCGRNSRFIVTARPYAYDDPNRRLARFVGPFALAPFDDTHIQQFIADWYTAVEKAGWVSTREAQDKSAGLSTAAQRVDLRPIAERPLLLTLMATLHTSRGKLPDDRADLYNDIVELLLWHWNESKGEEKGLLDALDVPGLKLPDIRRKIEQVAFEAHEAQGHQEGPADIACDDIIRTFRPLLGGSRDKAALVIEYIEKRAGLLNGLGEKGGCDRYAFPHRTFQEYLAGCYLAGRDDFRVQAPGKVQAAPAQWREVFVLGARHARADRGIPAADALIQSLPIQEYIRQHGRPDENRWRSAVVAGLALLEIGQAALTADPAGVAVRDRVAGWLLALIQTPRLLPLADRIEAGNTLGRLGDPRFSVRAGQGGVPYILPQPVRVEAGPFEMGSNKGEPGSFDDEYSEATRNKRHVVTTGEFWIEPYPVTNAEYRCFVQSTGHEAPEHWRDGNAPAGLETHPVVNVSWRDASGYQESRSFQFDCPPKPSGKRPHAGTPRRNTRGCIPGAMSGTRPGAIQTRLAPAQPRRSACIPMVSARMDCWTRRAIYSSGHCPSLQTILTKPTMGGTIRAATTVAWCVEARGATIVTTRAARPAAAPIQAIATATLVFEWWSRPALAFDTLIPENSDP